MRRFDFDSTSLGRVLACAGFAALAWLGGAAAAHDGAHAPAARNGGEQTVEVDVLDLELADQHGRPANFRTDVIGERIAVINFIYTSCGTVCPVTTAIFAQLQQRLAGRLGDEVQLVSLSVDPVTDSPGRLRAYARKHGAGPGWTWLTGNKLSMDRVLEGLGAYTPNYQDHPAMVLVGDVGTGRWTRFFGFPSPDRIVDTVDALLEARGHSLSATAQP